MKISDVIAAIDIWAGAKPLIQRVYVFGSRVRGDTRLTSDLDVAIELDPTAVTDTCDRDDAHAVVWTLEADGWQSELRALLLLPVDLQHHRGQATPDIVAELRRSHVLAHEKTRPTLPWLHSPKLCEPRAMMLLAH